MHEVFCAKQIQQWMAPMFLKLLVGQKHNLARVRLGRFRGSTLRLLYVVDPLCNTLQYGAEIFMPISNLCYRVFKFNFQFSCTAFVLHVLMVVEEGVKSLPSHIANGNLADTSNRSSGKFQLLPK